MSGRSLDSSKAPGTPLIMIGGDAPPDTQGAQYEGKVIVKGDIFGTGSIVLAKLHTAVLYLFEVPDTYSDVFDCKIHWKDRSRLR